MNYLNIHGNYGLVRCYYTDGSFIIVNRYTDKIFATFTAEGKSDWITEKDLDGDFLESYEYLKESMLWILHREKRRGGRPTRLVIW